MPEHDNGSLTLGLDLGSSAVKILALDADGTVRGAGAAAFPTASDAAGRAEQDPADWSAALAKICAALDGALCAQYRDWRSRVVAIGLTGQLPTLVCLGARGPLGAAITWQDARADAWAAAAIDAAERRSLYACTGMPIDGRYLGPMFHYHWLERAAEIEWVLSAKDYLCWLLTGERLTDPSTAAGYGAFDLGESRFSPSLVARWRLPAQALPAIRSAHALAGPLTASGARLLGLPPGIPVTVGAADSVCSAFAMAGLEEGVVCIAMGSSTVIIDAVRDRRLDHAARYLLTPHVADGWYGREMDLLATGTGYDWLSRLLAWPAGELERHAAKSCAGANGLTFTPYLAGGEQGALWDPTLRGAIAGLTLKHTTNDIARAFLEGICFEIRRCVEVLGKTSEIRSVIVSGHFATHAESLQLLADVLGHPLRRSTAASTAAFGAARGARLMVEPTSRAPELGAPSVVALSRGGADYQPLYARYLAAAAASAATAGTRVDR